MPFSAQKFILFDVQTTGTNPETCAIIEAGWGIYQASADPSSVDWQIRLVALSASAPLSRRIQKLTGLVAKTWDEEPTVSYEALIAELCEFLRQHDGLPILVHYARFKRPFLLKALADSEASESRTAWISVHERVACTYELARRVMPHLKSFSLRAVAGYAGYSLGDKKRSRDHLIATAHIWKYMVDTVAQPEAPTSALPLHEAGIRQKRLALPDAPGVYYFMDHAARILYVGKASSLKHRLNSYFRGQKTKGSRLNEMLTRAIDFQFRIVRTELEALFLESDEIKRLDPPYNRLLKTDERCVQSLRLNDWLELPASGPIWGWQFWGPMLSLWNFQWLLSISGIPFKADVKPGLRWLESLLTKEILDTAKTAIFGTPVPTPEAWASWGQALWEAARAEQDEAEDDDADEEDLSPDLDEATPEQAAALIQHALLHALRQLHRSRWLLRLMECTISWRFRGKEPSMHQLTMRSGVPHMHEAAGEPAYPEFWQKSRRERLNAIDLPTYDRLNILYSGLRQGLRRGDHIRICLRPGLILDQDALQRYLLEQDQHESTVSRCP